MQRDCGQSSGDHSRVHQITTVTLIYIISREREGKKSTSVCLKANLGRISAECDSLFFSPTSRPSKKSCPLTLFAFMGDLCAPSAKRRTAKLSRPRF